MVLKLLVPLPTPPASQLINATELTVSDSRLNTGRPRFDPPDAAIDPSSRPRKVRLLMVVGASTAASLLLTKRYAYQPHRRQAAAVDDQLITAGPLMVTFPAA